MFVDLLAHINSEIFNVVKWLSSWFFHSTRGLRQDPLSPSLFVIMMEVLSWMTSTMVTSGFVVGFSIGTSVKGVINISHLLFTDDTLIFYEANLN